MKKGGAVELPGTDSADMARWPCDLSAAGPLAASFECWNREHYPVTGSMCLPLGVDGLIHGKYRV